LIDAGLDAMNVDVKGDEASVKKFCKGIDAEKVWAVCRLARTRGVHIEITTLVIPTVNDTDTTLRMIAGRIVSDLGVETPWHISRYYPAYRFALPPTLTERLESAWQIGRELGLEFVYVGNLPGHPYDNTFCPRCKEVLIRRSGFSVVSNVLRDGRCPRCGRPAAGVW
jgi:pyruvate formate lyase activating enzyme